LNEGNASGPAAMAPTSIGTVFLYEAGEDDIREYGEGRDTAEERIRRLLQRIASKSSADAHGLPGTLTAAEVQSLTQAEVESLFEIYLGSPLNQWYQMKSLEANNPIVRGGGESASAFFDRLMTWYAASREAAARERLSAVQEEVPTVTLESVTARLHASQRSMETTLRWGVGALILGLVVLSAGASWLGYQSMMRDRESDRKAEAWQREMKMLAENNSAMERGFTEMATENARLKARLEMLEAREPPASAKRGTATPARKASSKATDKAARQSAKK
jgi:hypothetical protein